MRRARTLHGKTPARTGKPFHGRRPLVKRPGPARPPHPQSPAACPAPDGFPADPGHHPRFRPAPPSPPPARSSA